jgi:hypothetical protein
LFFTVFVLGLPGRLVIENSDNQHFKRELLMDDYQEELLELRAGELDPPEPADDATEL